MKAYMAFSREDDEDNGGAVLVFANSVKEAKRTAWTAVKGDITDEYIDLGIRLVQHQEYFLTLMDKDEPYVDHYPPCCEDCGLWGAPINSEGYCEDCKM